MLINITSTKSRGTRFFIHLASEMVCDRVVATWGTATYMLVHVPKLFLYTLQSICDMSPYDPMAILVGKIFDEYDTTGKISDYKWCVSQTPATNQWYLVRYTKELVKNATMLGRVKYVINNQDGYIHIVELT